MSKNKRLNICLIPFLAYMLVIGGMTTDIVICFCEKGQVNLEVADGCLEECLPKDFVNSDLSVSSFREAHPKKTESKCSDVPLYVGLGEENSSFVPPSTFWTGAMTTAPCLLSTNPSREHPHNFCVQRNPFFKTTVSSSLKTTILLI